MSKRHIHRNVVGPSVQRCRSARGWSQQMLATKCQLIGWDISRSIVAAIEGRVRWVADWEVLLLARVFKVSLVDLYPVNFRGDDVGLSDIYMHRDDEGRAVAEGP